MKKGSILILSLAVLLFLAACGGTGAQSAVGERGNSTAAAQADEDSEAYISAKACYDALMETDEEAQYQSFTQAQSALNHDGNNSRYFVEPDSAAKLPKELNETALALGDYRIGISPRTDYGYFVVMRLPFDTDELTEIKNAYVNERFNEVLNEAAGNAETAEADVLKQVDFTAYMEALGTLQTQITERYSQLSSTYSDAEELEEHLLDTLPDGAKEDCTAYLTEGLLKGSTPVMTVDGTEVLADMLFYFLNYEKNSQLGAGETSDAYLVTLLNLAKQDVVKYTTARNLAQENAITLSAQEQGSVQEVLDNTMESSMLYLGCNTGVLENILLDTAYGNAYAAYLYGENGVNDIPDEEVVAYAEERGYYTCLYIWFCEDNTDGE